MATINAQLNVKTSTGYDVINLESSSGMITYSNPDLPNTVGGALDYIEDNKAPLSAPTFSTSIILGTKVGTLGTNSIALGTSCSASGAHTFTQGNKMSSIGDYSHSMGNSTNSALTIIPTLTTSTSNTDIMTAWNTNKFSLAKGASSSVSGVDCLALDSYAQASGYNCYANGFASIASGYNAKSTGLGATSIGQATLSSGDYATSLGRSTTASNSHSMAINRGTTASGDGSFASGYYTVASGVASVALGNNTISSSAYSFASGSGSEANGVASVAQNSSTISIGENSTATGNSTQSQGINSFSGGKSTVALANQLVFGHYNNQTLATANNDSGTSSGSVFVLGNGISGTASNAFRVTGTGLVYAKGAYSATGADYAEYFEWIDGNINSEDRRGLFVTLDGDKIKIANDGDDVLGIVSSNPCIIGNGDECWQGAFERDEFGTTIYETKEVDVLGEDGSKTGEKVEQTFYKVNPNYDPTVPYIQRADRKEYDAIGLTGVLVVKDDGSCKVNGYCKCGIDGIAMKSDRQPFDTFRVIKRVNDNLIKVVIK